MKRVLLAAIALLGAAHLVWAEEPRQRLMNIPLDMPLEEELDGEFLEGIYQEKLLPELKDSVLIETPIQHIESHFTDDRALELWFSSREDGRRVFWAHLTQSFAEGKESKPETALANFEAIFGKPDVMRESKSDISGSWILIKIDPRLSDERRATIQRQLDASFNPTPDQIGGFSFLDMRDRIALLGPDFRGAIFSFSAFKGKVGAQQTELLDMVRAHSVLNLAPQ
ncbi:MAG TPA: hypothetical protein VG742_07165 [Dongiaceae bacterium]|nr:hypothetical protein [Dongiaceae bacterium]